MLLMHRLRGLRRCTRRSVRKERIVGHRGNVTGPRCARTLSHGAHVVVRHPDGKRWLGPR